MSGPLALLVRIFERVLGHSVRWGVWLVVHGLALGVGAYMLSHPAELGGWATNKLELGQRLAVLWFVGPAFAVVLSVHLLRQLWTRWREGVFRLEETVVATQRVLHGLLAVPFGAALLLPGIEKESPRLAIIFAAIGAMALGVGVWNLQRETAHEQDTPSKGRDVAGWALVVVAGLLYAAFMSKLTITQHHALNTRTVDLGYYDNIFYHSIHGRPLGCTLIRGGWHGSAHFDPILVLLSPLYLLYPRAELLLVLQSVWCALGVIPLYMLSRRVLSSRVAGLLVCLAYLFYVPLQGANAYEFHSLTLAAPLVLSVLVAFELRRPVAYVILVTLALLCREDIPLLLGWCSLAFGLSGKPHGARWGLATAVTCAVYFAIVKVFLMESSDLLNSGKDAHSYAYYFADLIPKRLGAGELALSVLLNPIFTLTHMLSDKKVEYFMLLFGPLLFAPFFAQRWGMLLYGMLFTFLASREPVFKPHFQYSSLLTPIAFALVPAGLLRMAERMAPESSVRFTRAAATVMVAMAVALSCKFGALMPNESFRAGFSKQARTLSRDQEDRYRWLNEARAKIPRDASVSATGQLGPHVSNRAEVYNYPQKVADYVIINESELKGKSLKKHQDLIQGGKLREISRHKKFALFSQLGADKTFDDSIEIEAPSEAAEKE